MVLKHTYNTLFYRRILRKKKLWDILKDLDARITADTSSDSAVAGRVEALETAVGSATGDNAGGIAKDVADLKTGKANSSHTHTISNVSDATTVDVVVTYADESTETIKLVKQVVSQ